MGGCIFFTQDVPQTTNNSTAYLIKDIFKEIILTIIYL
jgi:hypothetical protein